MANKATLLLEVTVNKEPKEKPESLNIKLLERVIYI